MYTIYGMEKCPACEGAKELFEKKGLDYEYRDVVKDANIKMEWQGRMASVNKAAKTVPQIFDEQGNHIGGFTDLMLYLSENN